LSLHATAPIRALAGQAAARFLPVSNVGDAHFNKIGRTTVIDIVEGVKEVIALHLGAVQTGMTEDAKLTDLGADSIDLYEVVMSLEEKFNVTIDDRDVQRFVTIGDAIAFIKGKVS
jgi:acyl carrier protein